MQLKKLLLILVPVVTFVLLFVIVGRGPAPKLTIAGLGKCSPGINKDVQATMQETIYSYIKQVNDYNKKNTSPSYKGEIRKNSCKTKAFDVNGVKDKLKSTTAIIDIPTAKQSWKISYDWFAGKVPDTVVNGTTVECVDKDEQVYGDFGCDKVLSKAEHNTDKYDPILQYIPYKGRAFDIDYDPNTRVVTANILVEDKDIDNAVMIQNDKDAVLYWFRARKINPDDYTIVYQVTPESPDDDDDDSINGD